MKQTLIIVISVITLAGLWATMVMISRRPKIVEEDRLTQILTLQTNIHDRLDMMNRNQFIIFNVLTNHVEATKPWTQTIGTNEIGTITPSRP